ncbi:MAG TPA: hypothetical protein VGO47_13050, partial [Chlamydiales bacterium]|nr:hypothetical protein [Chlamydiales bacterium]
MTDNDIHDESSRMTKKDAKAFGIHVGSTMSLFQVLGKGRVLLEMSANELYIGTIEFFLVGQLVCFGAYFDPLAATNSVRYVGNIFVGGRLHTAKFPPYKLQKARLGSGTGATAALGIHSTWHQI